MYRDLLHRALLHCDLSHRDLSRHHQLRRQLVGLLGLVLLGGLSQPIRAHDYRVGDIRIEHPWALAMPPGASSGAVYFRVLRNLGARADELKSARSSIAPQIEIHSLRLDGDVMRMRAVTGLNLPAQSTVAFNRSESNTHHLMLIGLKSPLQDGQTFPLWLRFREAGEIEVKVVVQTPKGQSPGSTHRH